MNEYESIPRREADFEIERLKGDFNTYASKKSVSQVELDTSVIAQYFGYIITLFLIRNNMPEETSLNGFQITFITLICTSLSIQIIMFIFIIILYNAKDDNRDRTCSIDTLNSWVGTLSHLVVILSIPITALAANVINNQVREIITQFTTIYEGICQNYTTALI